MVASKKKIASSTGLGDSNQRRSSKRTSSQPFVAEAANAGKKLSIAPPHVSMKAAAAGKDHIRMKKDMVSKIMLI